MHYTDMRDAPDHRADCQLRTIPGYGLCTCDFDARAKAAAAVVRDNSVFAPEAAQDIETLTK